MLRQIAVLLLLLSFQAVAIEQCDSRFPTPVNGLTSGTKLKGGASGRVYGTSNHELGFKYNSRLDTSNSFRCYDGGWRSRCSASGTLASNSGGFPSFQTQGGSRKIEVGENRSRTLGGSDGYAFEEILVKEEGSLTFAPGQTYHIDTLKLEEGADATLGPGTYWVEKFELGEDTRVYVNGDVVLHVRTMVVGEYSQVNMTTVSGEYQPQKLDIWNHSNDLVLKERSKLAGYIYSADKIKLEEKAEVYGALSGTGEVVMEKQSRVYGGYPCSSGPEPTSNYIRFGRVDVSSGSASISFDDYSGSQTPLLFLMTPISRSNPYGDPPAMVHVDSISTSGATIRTRRSDGYSDAKIGVVDYLVIEPGIHHFADANGRVAVTMEAGSGGTCNYIGKNSGGGSNCDANQLSRASFGYGFAQKPAVIAQLQSHDNLDAWWRFYNVNIDAIDTGGVNLSLEGNEAYNYFQYSDLVGWLAVQGSGTVEINGESLQVESGTDLKNHPFSEYDTTTLPLTTQCEAISSFSPAFPATPYFFAHKRGRRGGDGGWARACYVSASQVSVIGDEDQQWDDERSHMGEHFSYLAIEAPAEVTPTTVRLVHPDSTISCVGAEVEVDLCKDSSCSGFDTSSTVAVTLSPDSSVTWQNTRTGDTGSTLQVRHDDILRLWQSDPVQEVDITMAVGSHPYFCQSGGAVSDCTITFKPSGLLLSIDAGAQGTAPGYYTSCKTGDRLQVAPVETSSSNPMQCLPLADAEEQVNFSFAYKSPLLPQERASLRLGGTDLTAGASLTKSLDFRDDGVDSLAIQYNEAGRLKVRASLVRGEGEGQVTLSGETELDWLPAGLHITAANKTCPSGDHRCSAKLKAGETVQVSVSARCWRPDSDSDFGDNPVTRNFLHGGIALTSTLVAPSGGADSGELPLGNDGQPARAAITQDGTGNVGRVLDEVGVFRFVPTEDIDYLGHQLPKERYSADNIGRVTPAYLEADSYSAQLAPYCNGFSYLGQPVAFSSPPRLTVTGHALGGGVTNNFDSEFWNLDNPMDDRRYQAQVASVVVHDPAETTVTGIGDGDGARTYSLDENWIRFERPSAPLAPIGTTSGTPAGSQTELTIAKEAFTISGDGVCLASDGDIGNCQGVEFKSSGANAILGPQLRYGRAVLASAYGSENQQVRMPLTLEYFNGLQFSTNLLDSGFYADGRAFNSSAPNASGRVILSGSLSPMPVTSGEDFARQGRFEGLSIAGSGRVTESPLTLTYNLDQRFLHQQGSCTYPGWNGTPAVAPTWLKWYWDSSNKALLLNPSAEVTLGRYRGHDKVIYRRELF